MPGRRIRGRCVREFEALIEQEHFKRLWLDVDQFDIDLAEFVGGTS